MKKFIIIWLIFAIINFNFLAYKKSFRRITAGEIGGTIVAGPLILSVLLYEHTSVYINWDKCVIGCE